MQRLAQSALVKARRWLDAVRRNHGLEHGTVAVLFGRRGPQRLAGRASGDGFFIIGRVDPDTLQSCAEEALTRMQRGEASLAVSPLCGTNLAVTGALTATATMLSLARNRGRPLRDRVGGAINAATIAAVIAQPVGRLVQERITTRGDVEHVRLEGVRVYAPGIAKVITRGA
jgi:hypothetical protein